MLGRGRAATACIDLSDGLADGIRRIAEASGVGAAIDAGAVPIEPDAASWFGGRGTDPVVSAMTGGDDYELLFTVRPRLRGRLSAATQHGKAPITRIGVCTSERGVVLRRAPGRRVADSRRIHSLPMIHLTRSLFRRWLSALLHIQDTPQRTAAAFALGVFFGFSPFLGLHTVMAVALAFLLNLNRVAVLLGVYSNLPWIIGAYYASTTMLGAAILRTRLPPGFRDRLADLFELSVLQGGFWRELARLLTPLLWPFTVGSTIGRLCWRRPLTRWRSLSSGAASTYRKSSTTSRRADCRSDTSKTGRLSPHGFYNFQERHGHRWIVLAEGGRHGGCGGGIRVALRGDDARLPGSGAWRDGQRDLLHASPGTGHPAVVHRDRVLQGTDDRRRRSRSGRHRGLGSGAPAPRVHRRARHARHPLRRDLHHPRYGSGGPGSARSTSTCGAATRRSSSGANPFA